MRTFLIAVLSPIIFLAVSAGHLLAQDPGIDAAQQASQQAMQAAQQASDQAMRDMQQASQNAQQAMQNAQQASDTTFQCARCFARMPSFSVKPGMYSAPVIVKIRDATRGAVIYYTLDGWTPTNSSTRYRGPVTIASTTTVQAIAYSPEGGRSRIASAVYVVQGATQALSTAPAGSGRPAAVAISEPGLEDGKYLLPQDTAVALAFSAAVTSKTADVGDKIPLTLAQDLKLGSVILLKKGTPGSAIITEVDKNGLGGAPGALYFEAESLEAGNVTIKLYGGAAKEGHDQVGKAIGLMFVPVVPVGIFVHGKDAEIQPGAVFTAFVDADTLLPPVN